MSFLSKITRIFRRRFSDKKIGSKSIGQRLIAAVSFRGFRQKISRWMKGFFSISQPAWLATLGKVRYSPTKKLSDWDYFNPIYWIIWLIGFSYRWMVSRPYMSLGPALLAILAILGLGGLMARQALEEADWRGQFYQRSLQVAIENGDDSVASVCLTNLVARYPEKVDWRFRQALLFEKRGDQNAAYREMLTLADRKEYGGAALWLLSKQFDLQKVASWTPEMHARYRKLSEIAIKDRRGEYELETRRQLADYLARTGAYRDAIIQLTEIAERSPSTYLGLARLHALLGDEPNTLRYAELAKKFYERQLLASADDKVARLSLAQAELMLHQEERAVMLLSEGHKLTQDQDLAFAGAETLVAWAAKLKRENPGSPKSLISQMDLLKKASQLAPRSEIVLDALVQIAIECADDKAEGISAVRQGLLTGVAPDSLHFIEGTAALYRGDLEQADFHLKLAAQGDLQLPGVLNNLAVVLYQKQPPELDRALAFANAALKQISHPYLHETRGQILVKLGDYQNAIRDLEVALQAKELAGVVHESLATSYRALGNTAMADEHASLANANKKSSVESNASLGVPPGTK